MNIWIVLLDHALFENVEVLIFKTREEAENYVDREFGWFKKDAIYTDDVLMEHGIRMWQQTL